MVTTVYAMTPEDDSISRELLYKMKSSIPPAGPPSGVVDNHADALRNFVDPELKSTSTAQKLPDAFDIYK